MSAEFTQESFKFLDELAANNNREWFNAHKKRFEVLVRGPALAFITELVEPLAAISPKFRAVPKAVGGSLFRIQRDTRFSNNKEPYKTWIGLRFFHERGRDGNAPLFYLHIQPGNHFIGGGLWHPQPDALRKVRDYLVANPASWQQIAGEAQAQGYRFGGDSLVRPPRGYDAGHPLIDDLKRKDFVLMKPLSDKQVLGPNFVATAAQCFEQAAPFVDWLCGAVEIDF